MNIKKVLTGQSVLLRPMVEQDLATKAHWMLDPEIRKMMGLSDKNPNYTYQNALAENYRWLQDARNAGEMVWAMDVDGKLVGYFTANVFDFERKAEIFILVGDKSLWGKGFGKEACALVLDELFRETDVYYVDTFVVPGNNRSYSLSLSLGFAPVGTQTGGTRVLRLIRKAWFARRKPNLATH